MEAIRIDKIKDEVAKKHSYLDWHHVIAAYKHGYIILPIKTFLELENEVISEVAKQVAEATKQSCAKKYKNECTSFFDYNLLAEQAILNAPIPEII